MKPLAKFLALLLAGALGCVTETVAPASPDPAPVVTPPVDTGVVFAGAGNTGNCRNQNDEATAKLLDALPGFVFTGGDNAFDTGSAEEFATCYGPTWGRHLARTYAVLGNHDYGLGNADAAFAYFGSHAGPAGKGYFSFTLGDWHAIVLNDNYEYVSISKGSEQELWLKADLAANTSKCIIALWHVPLFQSTDTPGYYTNPMRKPFWDDLYAAGADVVISGTLHHYERFAPMNPDGIRDVANGIRQFNVGTGGESVLVPTVAIHPNSEVIGGAFGVLKLTLKKDSYEWEFLPIAGQTFTDSGSGRCHDS